MNEPAIRGGREQNDDVGSLGAALIQALRDAGEDPASFDDDDDEDEDE
jgi:hypothetical protein